MYQLNDAMMAYYLAASGAKSGALMTAGVVTGKPLDVRGCRSFHVIVSSLNGSDVLQVQGRLTGSAWFAIGPNLDANMEYTFSGIWHELQVIRVSGTGTTTSVTIGTGL